MIKWFRRNFLEIVAVTLLCATACALIFIFGYVIHYDDQVRREMKECQNKNGTYWNGTCLDIKSIPLTSSSDH